ncbi:MAG: hypothetical protein IJC07_00340 [Clostridia bacterium]|nr:hypothetical protein [Clostridia bacterium]
MKKKSILSLLLSAFLILSSLLFSVSAVNKAFAQQTEYLRVITKDTPFYSDTTEGQPLFFLPYTYYVKVLGEKDGFYHVECCPSPSAPSIDGYVPKELLFKDSLEVSSPYPNVTITCATTAVLYFDAQALSPIQYVFPERTLRYYGSIDTEDGLLFYVGYNGKLGYVKEDVVYPFTIPDHPNKKTFLPKENVESAPNLKEPSENSNKLLSLKVIIIGCFVFAGGIALFMLFRLKKVPTTTTGYYDENEYE